MLLVEYGAKVDAWEQFAIYVPSHEAAIMGNLVVELLLDHGADANTQLNNCNISWKTSGRRSLTRGGRGSACPERRRQESFPIGIGGIRI